MNTPSQFKLFHLPLIAFTGFPEVGKDTAAQYLNHRYGFTTYGFADPLKAAMSEAFGIPLQEFYTQEGKKKYNGWWKITNREILQFAGTEMFREQIRKLTPWVGEDFWVRRMQYQIQKDSIIIPTNYSGVCFNDARFPNEFQYVYDNNGIIVEIRREGYTGEVGIAGHASNKKVETINPERTYLCVNNGTLEEFYTNLDTIIAAYAQHRGHDILKIVEPTLNQF